MIASLLVCSCAMAQSTYSIQGKVVEKATGETIIGAAVRVLTVRDSTFVKGASTGTTGAFDIKGIKNGKYILHVSYMGMMPQYHNMEVRGEDLSVGKIALGESVTRLNVVEVTAQANPVTIKKDTIQFNASAFRVREGANLEELLRRIPGMEVDDDGNIKYNGEAIERIEMDGRNFFSSTPQIATRNLPSNMIKNLQVVDKKSDEAKLTGMDNGEKIKVLNLEIKEDKKKGWIANASAGYGTRDRYKSSLMLNHFNKDARYTLLGDLNNVDGVRRGRGNQVTRSIGANYDDIFLDKKLKVTGEVSYDNRDMTNSTKVRTEQLLGGEARNVETEQSYSFSRSQYAHANSRMEYNPSDKTMIVFEPRVGLNWSKSNGDNSFTTVNNEGKQINDGSSETTSQSKGYNLDGMLQFSHKFNDLGRNIYARLFTNYTHDAGDGITQSITKFYNGSEDQQRNQYNDSFNNSFRVGTRIAYLEPINKHWAVQLTYHIDYYNRESNQAIYNKDNSGEYSILDTQYSRGSKNTSFTQRLETRIRHSFDKNSIYVGFGANPSYTHTTSTQGRDVTFDKDCTVWNYAPSLIMDIRPNDSLQFNLRYMGRTSQPSMSQLNPATIITSPLAQTVGNPDLLPAFSHSVDVTTMISRRAKRQSFSLMGSYNYVQSAVAAKQTIDPATGARTTTYENIDGNQSLRTGFMINTPIGGAKSKWTSFSYGHIMYSKDKGFVNGELNSASVWQPNIYQKVSWNGAWLQATAGGFISMQDVSNSFSKQMDRRSWDYNVSGEAIFTIPNNVSLSTKLTYQDARGYNDCVKRDFWLWDASVSWSFLKAKNATLELSAYDLLQQRTSFNRRITANSIIDREFNGVTSYAMLTFTYRFNNMGGGVSVGKGEGQRRWFGGRGGRPRF